MTVFPITTNCDYLFEVLSSRGKRKRERIKISDQGNKERMEKEKAWRITWEET